MTTAHDARHVWWDIRALRANPPGAGGLPNRKPTFSAALEQCEQLFLAAATVGYAARPLPLFYALSQAGRAMVAAFELSEDRWQLKGHGISSVALDSGRLWDVEQQDQRSGSFVRVAEVLHSPSLPERTRLGDLWATLPGLAGRLPTGAYRARVLRVEREVLIGPETFGGPNVYATSVQLSSAWLYGVDPDIEFSDDPKEKLREHLTRYPSLAGFEVELAEDRPIKFHPAAVAGELGVRLTWLADGMLEEHRAERISRMCQLAVDGSQWVAPAVAGNQQPLHPLIAWWAVLHALSMLARYEPAAWDRHRDIDASPDAAAVESLLDQALVEVPELILHILTQ